MQQEVSDYLQSQRVGVLALKMPDGSVNGATLHFAYSEDPFELIFLTSPKSRKGQALQDESVPASFVVGVSEEEMKTFQVDGEVRVVDAEEVREIYLQKFTEKLQRFPDNVHLEPKK